MSLKMARINGIMKIKASYDDNTDIETLLNILGERYIIKSTKFVPKTSYSLAYIEIKTIPIKAQVPHKIGKNACATP